MAVARRIIAVGLGLTAAVAASAAVAIDLPRGDPRDAGMSAERLERVRVEMDRLVESGEFPGMTAMIARRGMIVFEHTTGLLDGRRAAARFAAGRPPCPRCTRLRTSGAPGTTSRTWAANAR